MPPEATIQLDAPGDRVFSVFAIDDFAGRMAAIRGSARPWLERAGSALAPALAEIAGEPIHAHVARHARRTVNPPEDTWVAFGPGKRGYKADRHFKIAVTEGAVRLLFEVGPEFAQKPAWAAAWKAAAPRLHGRLTEAGLGLSWFAGEHDEEPGGVVNALSPPDFAALADRLTARRDGQLVLGAKLTRAAAAKSKESFGERALAVFTALAPCYRLGS